MPASESEQENPYASPKSSLDAPAEPGGDRDCWVIHPWIRPRDPIDLLLVGLTAALIGAPPIAVAGVLISLPDWCDMSRLGFPIVALSAAVSMGVLAVLLLGLVAWLLIANLLMVSHLEIDASGIMFERRRGTPRFLAWTDIQLIRRSTRREVFLRGWLWPLPTKEPTKTLSAWGHYRIEWTEGYLYFPPRDPSQFLSAICEFRPELLDEKSNN